MPTRKPPAVLVASTLPQLESLKSRLRGRICDVVYHLGSATVNEIGERLGSPVSTLYDHLEILVEVGLLLEGEPVRTTKNFARTFVAPARELRVTHQSDDPEIRAAIADIVASQLRFGEKEFRAALVSGETSVGRPDSPINSGSTVGWLGPSDLKKLNALLAEAMAIFEGSSPGPDRQLQGITFVSRPAGR